MAARNYINGAPLLTLSAGITNADVTLTVSSTTGYPAAPFTIALERATVNEEVVLCTAKTGTTFTVTRGYDGTTAKNHAISAALEHTTASIDYNEANTHINDTSRDDHSQYSKKSLWSAKGVLMGASSASTPSAVTVGADNTVLTAASGQSTGVQWGLVGTNSMADGSVTQAKLDSTLAKRLIQSVAGYGSVGSPIAGQEVYDSSVDRYVAYMGAGWTYRPSGVGKITYSGSAPSGGIDGDVWFVIV